MAGEPVGPGDVVRLERRISSRNESLARLFDRVLAVLEAWGYVDDWTLTDAGRLLTRLNTEADLVLSEAIREGQLDAIEPPTMAAVVSCFAFQRRGPDGNEPLPPRRWPNQQVARRARAFDAIWRGLAITERENRLRETRRPTRASRPRSTAGAGAKSAPTFSTRRR